MSQFSNGKLEVLRRRGLELPLAGGYDDKGNLTTDPGAILKSHRALPIGFWKGSGLAIVLDLAAALISNGDATKDICKRDQETGVSQVFIAIDIESRVGASYIGEKTDAILNSLLETPPIEKGEAVRYPGQNLAATRAENLEKGVPIEPELWQTIQNL
jgi:3-dehydro-L-gulonate 2-dehydrogenase